MKCVIAISLTATVLLTLAANAKAEPTQSCHYDPNLGVPNPFGLRAYLTITEEDGNTTFQFEQFPCPVGDGQTPVTISSTRELTFYSTGVEEARSLMLQKAEYYSELVGYDDPDGFGPEMPCLSVLHKPSVMT